jgi:hypothetical protein
MLTLLSEPTAIWNANEGEGAHCTENLHPRQGALSEHRCVVDPDFDQIFGELLESVI